MGQQSDIFTSIKETLSRWGHQITYDLTHFPDPFEGQSSDQWQGAANAQAFMDPERFNEILGAMIPAGALSTRLVSVSRSQWPRLIEAAKRLWPHAKEIQRGSASVANLGKAALIRTTPETVEFALGAGRYVVAFTEKTFVEGMKKVPRTVVSVTSANGAPVTAQVEKAAGDFLLEGLVGRNAAQAGGAAEHLIRAAHL